MTALTRRQILAGGFGLASLGALAACSSGSSMGDMPGMGGATTSSASTGHAMGAIPTATPLTPKPGQKVVTATLRPRPVTLDLGGIHANTWAYTDELGTAPFRASAGDLLRITVDNQLPSDTSVHWHGIRVRNVADGVPGVTQQPIAKGARYLYEFEAPDAGTYFFHPHTGVQIDRGLYAPLVIDDPKDKGGYDAEWVVVLDDWTDGIPGGKNPDTILADFQAKTGPISTGMNHDMSGMDHGMASPLGDAGDIAYPHYLINGRIPAAPRTFTAKPGQKVRIRFINAGSDTIFKVALGGHTMTVTHSDGYAVQPQDTKALYIAMGERYDVLVTLADGAFPLAAAPEGKKGTPALAVVRTGAGTAPTQSTPVSELAGAALVGTSLTAADAAKLSSKDPARTVDVQLNGQMKPYAWGINGKKFGEDTPMQVREGERLRMRMTNMTMMAHPMHIHGHTWALPASGGLRKDTVLVLPMQTVEADLQADNPGTWMYHCHNIYHAELGMMTSLRYA